MKNKIIYAIVFLTISAIVTFNIQVVMSNGSSKTSLTLARIEKLAFGEDTKENTKGDNQEPKGPRLWTYVKCKTQTTTVTTTTNNNANNNGWSAGGSVNAGWGPVSGSANGNYNNSNSTSTTSSTTTTTSTGADYEARKYYCPGQDNTSCNPFDPCK